MEDRHRIYQIEDGIFCNVLDGHRGAKVAEFAKDELFKHFAVASGGPEEAFRYAFAITHDRAPHNAGGACAVAFYLRGDVLTVANVGDSHALLVAPGGLSKMTTVDHRLGNKEERERVTVEYGAFTDATYVYHPNGGGLMPTRSLGDHAFNDVGIIAKPSVSSHEFKNGYLIVATDGLWDYASQTAVAACCEGTAEETGKRVLALVKHTKDNLTIVVLRKT